MEDLSVAHSILDNPPKVSTSHSSQGSRDHGSNSFARIIGEQVRRCNLSTSALSRCTRGREAARRGSEGTRMRVEGVRGTLPRDFDQRRGRTRNSVYLLDSSGGKLAVRGAMRTSWASSPNESPSLSLDMVARWGSWEERRAARLDF
jgi:hypothetical protein